MMNLTKSSNPVFKENVFSRDYSASSEVMTVNGTINKTALMLLMVIAAAIFTWNKFFEAIAVNPEAGAAAVMPWLIVGGIGGLITALVTAFPSAKFGNFGANLCHFRRTLIRRHFCHFRIDVFRNRDAGSSVNTCCFSGDVVFVSFRNYQSDRKI